ncbi:hydrolase, NUDIX family [Desulfococcus multivorans]|nr:hydrolase, NUDIX family [Desulfococcus multivorans]
MFSVANEGLSTASLFCDEDLLAHIRANLDRFTRQTHDKKGYHQAAVAITVVDIGDDADVSERFRSDAQPGDAAVLLTRRALKLRKHAGQWALPGGRMDTGERPEETALRELEEEVGLRLHEDRILGRLDDYSTRSGFTIKPVVVWGGRNIALKANPDEVASIHRIPLVEFMRTDAPILQKIADSDHPVLLMPIGENWIAAPTAAMIYQFREVAILGNDRRVAHYEQPYFARQ